MKITGLTKSNLFIFSLVSIIYIFYSTLVFKPWELIYFSFIDDGQVLLQSGSFLDKCLQENTCVKFIDQTFEFGTSRLRPAYWLLENATYKLFRYKAVNYHVFRVYVIGTVSVLLLVAILVKLGVTNIIIALSSILFFTSYSFTENIIRLGTNEPFQVIFLALFSILYLKRFVIGKNTFYSVVLILLLIWTLLIKETDLALLPAIFLTELISSNFKIKGRLNLIVVLTIPAFLLISYLKKFLPSTLAADMPLYVNNYETNLNVIFNNSIGIYNILFITLSPFLKIILLVFPLMFLSRNFRKIFFEQKVYYWFFFSIFFIGIMFPWKYVLERYQLPGIFGLIVLISFVLDKLLLNIGAYVLSLVKLDKKLARIVFNTFLILIISNLFFYGFTINFSKTLNYVNWFKVFTEFEHDQAHLIYKYKDHNLKLNAVNSLNDWEFLYEIPIHLRYLYGVNVKISLLDEIYPGEYVFSRSSLDPFIKLTNGQLKEGKIVEQRSYKVSQIDPLKFRDNFIWKPIETLLDPPLFDDLNYYWEIRLI